jgi:hypothetical protein
MNYLVAYDYSADSDLALNTVLKNLSKKSDKVFLVNVVEHLQKRLALFGGTDKIKDAQKTLEREHQLNLRNLVTNYQSQGVSAIPHIIITI